MKFDNLSGCAEKFKRKWLTQIYNKYPDHILSYVPMLSDYDEADRKAVIKDFLDEFELLKKQKRLSNEIIEILHDYIRYSCNSVWGISAADARYYYFHYLELSKKPQILFLDPDSGFYAVVNKQKYVDVKIAKSRKNISIYQIELLLERLHEDSIIYTYQYYPNEKYCNLIETDLDTYLSDKPINFTAPIGYQDSKCQIKLYCFKKQIS